MPMPIEIIGLGRPTVRFVWDEDGDEAEISARDLRIACVCAVCQSETTGERLLDPQSVSPDLIIDQMSLVGNYGLSVHFSDGHSTGIYRFAKLYDACHGDQEKQS